MKNMNEMRACARYACVRAIMSIIASCMPLFSLHMFKGRFGKRPSLEASLPVSTGALGTGAPSRWHLVPSVRYAGFFETGYEPKNARKAELAKRIGALCVCLWICAFGVNPLLFYLQNL